MAQQYLISLAAGGLTSLSPCVLPALPLVVGSAFQQHRLGPLAVALGMTTSFVVVGVSIASAGTLIGLEESTIRSIAGILLVIAGAILISKTLQGLVSKLLTPLANKAEKLLQNSSLSGILGQFVVGLLLGAIWSPCTGPTLGAAAALAAQADGQLAAASIMFVFGLGASIPLLAIAYGLRSIFVAKRSSILTTASKGKTIFGIILIVVGAFVLSGNDKSLEAMLLNIMPDWLLDFTTQL